jgi:hypothetical protein
VNIGGITLYKGPPILDADCIFSQGQSANNGPLRVAVHH